MQLASPVLGPFFFFCYTISVAYVLINMFLTILNESFSYVRDEMNQIENDYEMVEFVIKKFKVRGRWSRSIDVPFFWENTVWGSFHTSLFGRRKPRQCLITSGGSRISRGRRPIIWPIFAIRAITVDDWRGADQILFNFWGLFPPGSAP